MTHALLTLDDVTESIAPASRERFVRAFEKFITQLEAEARSILEKDGGFDEGKSLLSRLVQAPNLLNTTKTLPMATLVDAVSSTNDQNPINPSLIVKLLSDKDTGLFKTRYLFNEPTIGVNGEDLTKTGNFKPAEGVTYPIVGGRHRVNTLLIIADALNARFSWDSPDGTGTLFHSIMEENIRVSLQYTGKSESDGHVAMLQQLDNTSRSVGATEKARIRVLNDEVGKDLDIGDLHALIEYGYVKRSQGAKTEVFKLAFAYTMPELCGTEKLPTKVSPETLGYIGTAIYSAVKSQVLSRDAADMLRFSTSKRYTFDDHIAPMVESVIREGWANLPDAIATILQDSSNLNLNAKRIAAIVAQKTVVKLGLLSTDFITQADGTLEAIQETAAVENS